MKPDGTSLHFFLGSNTPQGFVSRFDQLADPDGGWRCYVLKGGPGTGKSTLLKKVAQHLHKNGHSVEYIHCSSDPESLDAVICPELKFSIADGTAPHAIEPRYPGAFETIVNLTACWDEDALYSCREEILSLSRSCSRCHEYCCRYLGAAAALMGDTYRIALDCLNTPKLSGYCKRLVEREFRPCRDTAGREQVRVFSAVTSQGVVNFVESAKLLCERIYLINDDHGAVSRVLLQAVRTAALAAGYDIVVSYCPLSPYEKLEYLFVPELKLGFMTSNRFHNYDFAVNAYRIVNSRRFTDAEKLRENRKRISSNRKAATQMISQAQTLLEEAKSLHDELEGYYIQAMDYEKLDALTEQVLERVDLFRQEAAL